MIFFYRFDYSTLSSWDEAWYGSIAREILTRNDWITMHFNGVPFYDHPPMGFWIMAVFYKIFGISEFSTRLPSVLVGIGTSILMYKMGEGFFGKKIIGFIAGLIVSTCVWYVIRVRSGNLDALFLFFYVATVYTAFLTKKTFKWFPICMISFGALIMTKTLAGASASAIILWFIFPYIFKSRWNMLYALLGIVAFTIIVVPWYHYHLSTNSSFYQYHFIHIGARDSKFTFSMLTHLQWELPLFYLHMGVRKWFYLWQLSSSIVCLSAIFHTIQGIRFFLQKKTFKQWPLVHAELGLIGWNVVILVPFLTTDLTQIWHLIPVYAPLALVVAYGIYMAMNWGIYLVKKIPLKPLSSLLNNQYVITAIYIIPFFLIAYLQIKTFYYEVFPTSHYVVDEVDILKKTKKYNKMVYIDRDYLPIAVYYSEQVVKEQPRYGDDVATMQNFIDQHNEGVLVIKNSAVDQYMKTQPKVLVLDKNNSFSIIREVK
ncbi:glycosyltransferase family 39 protein [soil metagenome]